MKNKIFLILFSLLGLNLAGSAQGGSPQILWSKSYGGSLTDKANDVLPLPDGGFIMVGESSSNDGDVSGNHGLSGNSDGWVAKVNASGNIEWQRSIGGDNRDVFSTIIKTSDNNYMCFGTTSSTNGDVVGNHGSEDYWMVKLNQQGTILWSRAFGGTGDEKLTEGIQTSDGGFALIGQTSSVNTGQVSGFHGSSGSDIWILKVAFDGSLIWQKCYGNANGAQEYAGDIMEDVDQNLVAVAHAFGIENDFPSFNNFNQYTFKVDKNTGNFIYNVRTGGRNSIDGTLVRTNNGFMASSKYVSTYYNPQWSTYSTFINLTTGIPDANPTSVMNTPALTVGPFGDVQYASYYAGARGLALLSDSMFAGAGLVYDNGTGPTNGIYGGTNDAMVGFGKFSSNSSSYGFKNFGGSGEEAFTSIKKLNSDNEFIVVGYSNSNNFDVSGNHGGFDFWVVKIRVPSLSNIIKGRIFVDKNSNGIKDPTEKFYSNAIVKSETPSMIASSQTINGMFQNSLDTGTINTTVLFFKPYYISVPALKTTTFLTNHLKDSFDFAIQPIPGKKDLRITIAPLTAARPGYEVKYLAKVENIGTENLAASLRLVKDPRILFKSSTTNPTTILNDTLDWVFNNLEAESDTTLVISFDIPAPPIVSLADIIKLEANVDPIVGDETTYDNKTILNQLVTGAFDPNDKIENHAGNYSVQQLLEREHLVYTIRFQNTGTDTAFKVRITDTLSDKLDLSTIEIIKASHNYRFGIMQNKFLTWTFENILLPDSNRNEPLSHGYVSFRIRPKSGLVLGDTIRNSASIYFDFNLPIQTNTQITVVKPNPIAPPAQPSVTGLLAEYCTNLGVQKGKINNLPAAGSGINVSAKLDATALTIGTDSSFSFAIDNLSAGSHVITVSFSNAGGTKTSTHNFTITTTINPDVNISSNIVTIVNLVDQVQLTASNALGGGSSPLYTFGRDRTFTNNWQAESGNSVLSINPSALSLGDNWIYIRMKSNAPCVSSTIATDSIKLVRSLVTSITDPDNPGNIISLYPNPFNKQVFIKGLSAVKTYTIVVSNINGQVLLQKKIANRSSVELELLLGASGNYLLSIYDEKRKKLLGTITMVKQ